MKTFEEMKKEICQFTFLCDGMRTKSLEMDVLGTRTLKVFRDNILSRTFTKTIIEICEKYNADWYIDFQEGKNTFTIYWKEEGGK